MSTRALIKFENNVMVYRHSDGYPSGVLIDLKDALLKGVRTYDVEYFIGGYLQQMGANHQKWLDDYYTNDDYYKDKDIDPELRNSVLGYGVFYSENEKELDYWQEYSYYFNENEVKVMKSDFSKCLRKFKYSDLMKMSDDEIRESVKRIEY